MSEDELLLDTVKWGMIRALPMDATSEDWQRVEDDFERFKAAVSALKAAELKYTDWRSTDANNQN